MLGRISPRHLGQQMLPEHCAVTSDGGKRTRHSWNVHEEVHEEVDEEVDASGTRKMKPTLSRSALSNSLSNSAMKSQSKLSLWSPRNTASDRLFSSSLLLDNIMTRPIYILVATSSFWKVKGFATTDKARSFMPSPEACDQMEDLRLFCHYPSNPH